MSSVLYMRSGPDDRTARAVIRDEALRLFASHGPDGVTVRQLAAAAGVSPGLVLHHFGSKEGLHRAVDEHVLGLFDRMLEEMTGEHAADLYDPEASGSVAEAIVKHLPADSAVPAYVRRLLLADGDAGRELFRRLFRLSAATLDALAAAGMAAPGSDPAVRAAFLLINDLAVLMLRDHLTDVLGTDPLSGPGMTRWAREVLAIYGAGLLAATPPGPANGRPGRQRTGAPMTAIGGDDIGGGAMTTARGTVLVARDVHKAYGRHQVLKGADLKVGPGQLVAVVGENGAGKSTLLRILAGTLGADRGEVRIAGTLGYCPQEPVVNDNLTVGQHLRYFAAARRLASLQRAGELVDLLRFGQYDDQAAGALSGGTRQKLNLTLALLHDPDVLLLDEPYQGFDWETYLRFWDVVGDLRARGKAIVIISHLVIEQDRFDILADLVDGRLTARVTPAENAHDSH